MHKKINGNEYRTVKKSQDWVFGGWLNRIERIVVIASHKSSVKPNEFPYDALYLLFSLVDSISTNLFDDNINAYLADIQAKRGDVGLSEVHIRLLVKIFRNGLIHHAHPLTLIYSDGEVNWQYGSGYDFSAYYFGDKEESPEKVFEYYKEKRYHACLKIDRFIALVRDDLIIRKGEESIKNSTYIVGQIVKDKKGNILSRPEPSG